MSDFFPVVRIGVSYKTQSGKAVLITKGHFHVLSPVYFISDCGLNFTQTGRCLNGTESDNLVLE